MKMAYLVCVAAAIVMCLCSDRTPPSKVLVCYICVPRSFGRGQVEEFKLGVQA